MAILPVISLFLVAIISPTTLAYNVVDFGARVDGRTDSTAAFLRAWRAACNSATPATVYVPRGTFKLKTTAFNGPCRSRIQFQIDGTLVAPHNHFSLGNSEFWIQFYKVSRLSIRGGTVDARGARYWSCRKHDQNCPTAAKVIQFNQFILAIELESYLPSIEFYEKLTINSSKIFTNFRLYM